MKALLLLPTLVLSSAAAAYADDKAASDKWNSWVDLEAKLGNNRSIGIVDGFAPVWQDKDSLVFFNPRFRLDDQDSSEYNLGFGYRHMLKDWVVGFYGFADRNRTPLGDYFNQATIGGEVLGTNLKFRLNDYQPFGDRHHLGNSPTVVATGGTLMISGGIETSMQGNDAEVGYRVPIYDANSSSQVWVYGGGYHFDASDTKAIVGPRARVEYNIGGVTLADRDVRLRLDGEIEHDSVRDTNYFAGIRIGIPFGGPSHSSAPLSQLQRHMIDPVERDVDIVTGAVVEPAVNPLSGNAVSSIVTLPSGDRMQASIDAAGDNAVIVLDGSNGDFVNSQSDPDPSVLTPFIMHDGQIFVGSGGSIALRGARSGVTASFNPGGTPATFNGIEWVELARNNAISGLTFTNGTNTIMGTDVGNFSLTHSTMTGSTSVSAVPVDISVSTPTTITIDHNSFLSNTVGAVRVNMDAGVTSAQLTYTNNIATNNGTGSQASLGSAFTIIATGTVGPTNLTMSGNTVTGNSGNAFYSHTSGAFTSFTGTFEDNNFSNNAGSGIVYATDATNASFTITGNNLSNLNDNAIGIIPASVSNLDLVVDHNQINNIGNSSNGIAIYGATNQLDMQITNNSISNTQGTAIINYNGGGTVPDINAVISHNTIENNQNLSSNAAGGIDIEGFDSLNITMDSNVLSNNTGGSIVSTIGVTAPTGATNVTFTNNSQTVGDAFTMAFDGNSAACANVHGNTSTTATAYNLSNAGAGTFTLSPATYNAVNTGGFNFTGTILSAASCP